MRKLIYLTSARDDLADILRYVVRESASASMGRAFIATLRQRCEHLANLPGTLGTARPELIDDIRSIPCRGYVIFFRYGVRTVEIVNILHASRDIIAYFDAE